MIEITSIVYSPDDSTPDSRDHYYRVPFSQATLVAGQGIQDDRKGGNPKRNLNVMSAEVLEALRREGFKTGPGQMGEQLILRGLDVNTLAAGDRLQLGASAVIEIVNSRTGCDRFEHIQGKRASQAAGRLGVMARVLTDGDIRVGDPVTVLSPVPAA